MIYTFNDYITITEALSIVKKASTEELKPYTPISIEGYTVIPTFHLKDERDNKARDLSLSVRDIKKLIRKALPKGLEDIEKGEGHLIMKNSEGKWDDYIVVKDKKKIVLKTIMLQDRNTPSYRIKEGDFKIIIEKIGLFDFTIIMD